MSPMQRTLASMRADGWKVGTVERFVQAPGQPGGGYRSDLFNIIDAIAIQPGRLVGVQVCGGADLAAHQRKLTGAHRADTLDWLHTGAGLVVYSWQKYARPIAGRTHRETVIWFTLDGNAGIVQTCTRQGIDE